LIALVSKQILNDRQRDEIQTYLISRPNKMPTYVRGLRMTGRSLDFPQMREDLDLLEELSKLDVLIGRKTDDYKELHAELRLRRSNSSDAKAVLKVKQNR